jgi:hypothetical protein
MAPQKRWASASRSRSRPRGEGLQRGRQILEADQNCAIVEVPLTNFGLRIMEDSQLVDLEEFKQLRDEMKTRLTLGNQLVSYTVTALAAGIAVLDRYPDAILGLTLVANCFWLLWLDHSAQVFKIAYYIAIRLAPRLQCGHDEILGWEYFVRKFDRGTLPEIESIPAGRFHPTRTAFIYTELLLGGSAGSLALIYGFLLQTSAIDLNRARICGLAVAMVFWVYAMIQAIRVALINRQIGKAILDQEPRGNSVGQN